MAEARQHRLESSHQSTVLAMAFLERTSSESATQELLTVIKQGTQ